MNFSFPSMQAKNRKSIEIGLALKKVEDFSRESILPCYSTC